MKRIVVIMIAALAALSFAAPVMAEEKTDTEKTDKKTEKKKDEKKDKKKEEKKDEKKGAEESAPVKKNKKEVSGC